MTTVKTEGTHAGAFIVSEANKTRSREIITVKHGQVLEAGAVIAYQTSTKKYVAYHNDETSLAAKAVLFDKVDATDGDVQAVALVRDCEVNGHELVWADTEDTGDKDAAIVDFATVGIIVRY
jgi:hypothetical protein